MVATIVIAVVVVLVLGGMAFEMWRTPAGIERERLIEGRQISSRTRTVTSASTEEALRLMQADWSWWHQARAEPMKDLGDGRKQFCFHPIRLLNVFEGPPAILIQFERVERLTDGGTCIHATLSGDFVGRAEYSARPGPNGTIIELAWVRAEARNVLRLLPVFCLAAIHCWRERIGIEGLRRRLETGR
jgi:hypothetical protein